MHFSIASSVLITSYAALCSRCIRDFEFSWQGLQALVSVSESHSLQYLERAHVENISHGLKSQDQMLQDHVVDDQV